MDPQALRNRLVNTARAVDFGPNAPAGLYLGVPESEYHAHPAISRSILAEAARLSPLHALHSWKDDEDGGSSDSMDLGTATHARVLQPDVFESRFDVAPDRCEGIKGDGDQCSYSPSERYGGTWYCGTHAPDGEPDDIEVLKSAHFYSAQGMAQALANDPDARPLLFGLPGLEEVTILWEDPETGLQCKARPDRIACLPDASVAIVDLKTTRSAHPQDFRRKYARNGYWLQAPFYGTGVRSLGVEMLTVRDFVFACVESSRPYAVQCFRPHDDDQRGAARRMDGLLSEMAAAQEEEPGTYRDGVASLSLRRYQKDRLSIA